MEAEFSDERWLRGVSASMTNILGDNKKQHSLRTAAKARSLHGRLVAAARGRTPVPPRNTYRGIGPQRDWIRATATCRR